MIKLKMMSPMPAMLGLTDNAYTMDKEIPFHSGMTTGDVMDFLAEGNPKFRKEWDDKSCAPLRQCLFAVNDTAVHVDGSKWAVQLEDGIELKIFMPYAGG